MELGESILTKKTKIEQVNKEFETFLKVEEELVSFRIIIFFSC